jgi:hypothetical protein
MSASGKKVIVSIMGFSVLGSLTIAGPLMFNLDAARDGGQIQDLAQSSALWQWGNSLMGKGGNNADGTGDSGNGAAR